MHSSSMGWQSVTSRNPVWEAYWKPRRKKKPAKAGRGVLKDVSQRATTPRQHARLTELLRRCNRLSFHWPASPSLTLWNQGRPLLFGSFVAALQPWTTLITTGLLMCPAD